MRHLRGTKLRLLVAAICAAALALAAVAWATPTPIPVVETGALNLNAQGNAAFDASQPPDAYFEDCALGDLGGDFEDDIGFTPANSVFSDNGDSDTFDGGLVLAVRSRSGTTIFEDSDQTGNKVGEQITVGPEKIQGLKVTRVETALQTSPTLRSLIKLRNKRNKAVKRTLIWDSDLGADGTEVVRASSTNDLVLTNADRWMVFGDDPATLDDPQGTFVLYGKGKGVKKTKVFNPVENADGCISFRITVKVPKRSSRYLLFFTEVHDNDALAGALADAKRFSRKRPRGVLGGVKKSVKKKVLNWDLGKK
jgi:hypothetical protein